MKILLVDPIGTGHHQEYSMLLAAGLKTLGMRVYFFGSQTLLSTLASASLLQDGIPFDEMAPVPNVLINEHARMEFLRKSLLASRNFGADICHFLYLDRFLISAVISRITQNRKMAVCATLHAMYFLSSFAPTGIHKLKGRIDFLALRFLTSRGLRVMVHSEKISKSLGVLTGTNQFDYVPYPVKTFNITEDVKKTMYARLRTKFQLGSQDILLLVFGGTRYDKGADLAVKMLSLLPPHYHLLFAGKDTYFSRIYLEGAASDLGLLERLHFDNRFIPEDEITAYFCGCDIVLIPYRRSFSGQSGPLTIAAALGTKVVAPDLPILAETMLKDIIGWLYPVENLPLMAQAIKEAISAPPLVPSEGFKNEHCEQTFTKAVAANYSKAICQQETS
ncbi:MAG: glycosyltransferase [Chloroflexi bacterium]|nr:glycosyltransferase [Chloroflexota bacterium]